MNIAIYLSLPNSQASRLTLLATLLSAYANARVNLSAVFISGNAAKIANDPNSQLSKLLNAQPLNIAVCSTSADQLVADCVWPIDGLGFWIEASTTADRVISL